MEISIGRWRVAVEQRYPSEEALQATYDQLAPSWHRSIQRMGFLAAYQSIFTQLPLSPTKRPFTVLEVGIGSGGLSEAFAVENGRTAHLTGVDISSAMLSKAHQTLNHRVHQLTLRQQDVRHLQLSDNQFDLVMGAHVLEHLPNPAVGLREMIRVAKPGATVLIIMTRRNPANAWLHLRWQIHATGSRQLAAHLQLAGLQNVRQLRFHKSIRCNWMSLVFTGQKPTG